MKYTQGKWEVHISGEYGYKRIVVVSGRKQICNVLNTVFDDERLANAKLIANAPIMVNIIQSILKSYQSYMTERDVEEIEGLLAEVGAL